MEMIKITFTEEQKRFNKLIKDSLKEEGIIIFNIVRSGQSYASSKRYKHARISIAIPEEICTDNLKDLNNWKLYCIAVPKINKENESKQVNN